MVLSTSPVSIMGFHQGKSSSYMPTPLPLMIKLIITTILITFTYLRISVCAYTCNSMCEVVRKSFVAISSALPQLLASSWPTKPSHRPSLSIYWGVRKSQRNHNSYFKSLAETGALVKSHCQSSTRAQSSATVSLLQAHCVNAPSEARFLSLETIWQNTAPIFCNKEASIIVKGQEHGKLHISLNINFPICKKRTTSVT